ncbi:hypothetical protein OLX02_08380 [Novosphingobium sp. KCTC 2891]|uniref:hypothetical protein n=1 Tax=Novosphingobium sp. KCTC 2891 TaxID=2989730 RepID=UPI002221FF90|nr:hypothetical protein [Novosphingobium sp. KCTC 2891]MCW1382839.1 hypothetical protein [Novosphingobium sp. KCTC 2891]
MFLDISNGSQNIDVGALRRAERIGLELPVRCRRGVIRSTVMLKDLTPYGARVDGLEKQRIGEPLTLLIPGLQAKTAYVVWSEPMASGLEFDHPLHQAVFDALVSDFAIGHYRKVAKRPIRRAA